MDDEIDPALYEIGMEEGGEINPFGGGGTNNGDFKGDNFDDLLLDNSPMGEGADGYDDFGSGMGDNMDSFGVVNDNFRDGDDMDIEGGVNRNDSKNSRNSSKNGDVRPGDWSCANCGSNNFARRDACFKCNTKKADSRLMETTSNFKPGDWACESCGNHNFAYRTECKKCGASKGSSGRGRSGTNNGSSSQKNLSFRMVTGDRDGRDGSRGFRERSPRRGDDRSRNNNSVSNGSNNVKYFASERDLPRGARDGDWECACSAHNFAFRDRCKMCDARRDKVGKIFKVGGRDGMSGSGNNTTRAAGNSSVGSRIEAPRNGGGG